MNRKPGSTFDYAILLVMLIFFFGARSCVMEGKLLDTQVELKKVK